MTDLDTTEAPPWLVALLREAELTAAGLPATEAADRAAREAGFEDAAALAAAERQDFAELCREIEAIDRRRPRR